MQRPCSLPLRLSARCAARLRLTMYKAIRKNPPATQAGEALLEALRGIPVSALSDSMHRNIGTVGLQPYQRPGKKTMAGTAVTMRSRGGDNLTYSKP